MLKKYGDSAGAIAEYEAALRIDPSLREADSNLGNLKGKRGDLQSAVMHHRAVVTARPVNAPTHYNLGYWLFQMDEFEEAEHEFRESIKCDPGAPVA